MRRAGILLGTFLLLGSLLAQPGATEAQFDARRAQPGRFVYRLAKDGRVTASFTLTITPQPDGNFRFSGDAAGFSQKWDSITTAGFQPIAARLRMKRGNGDIYAMELNYGNGAVDGTTLLAKAKTPNKPAPGTCHDTVRADTIDQRIDWAAVLSSRLEPDSEIVFSVYDPETGVSQVHAKVLGEAESVVPAGTFATIRASYRIDKKGGSETYEIFVTKTIPRVMVEERFPNGVVTELIEVEAPAPSQ